MLAIFVIYSTSNSLQWIQYSIITNVVMEYYQVSLDWVNWTSMIYMITYIPLIFPASWILDKWVRLLFFCWKCHPSLSAVFHFRMVAHQPGSYR